MLNPTANCKFQVRIQMVRIPMKTSFNSLADLAGNVLGVVSNIVQYVWDFLRIAESLLEQFLDFIRGLQWKSTQRRQLWET